MATIANLVVNLTAQTADLQRSVDEGNKTLGRFESTVTRVSGAIAAMASARAVVAWGQDMVGAFAEQEDALASLRAALEAQGQATPGVIAQYEGLASQFQKTTVFGDELTLRMQALLVQIGNVMPTDMDRALRASMDLASGLKVDLKTATELVGKAFAGETGTLKRYGIVIDEAALKTRGADAVLEAISDRFGGQAAAAASTYTGKMTALSNQIGDFKEIVGGVIVDVLLPMIKFFTDLPGPIQTAIVGFGVLVTALAPLGIAAGGIALAFGTTIPAAFAALLPFLGPAGLIVAGVAAVVLAWKNWDRITAIARAVYEGIKTWLIDRFAAVVQGIKDKIGAVTGFFENLYQKVVGGSFVPDLVNGVLHWFTRMGAGMVSATQAATTQVGGLFSTLGGIVQQHLSGLNNIFQAAFTGGGGMAGAVKSFTTGLLKDFLNLIPGVGPIISQFSGAIVAGFSKIGGFIKQLFGGPSAQELGGREVMREFERNVNEMFRLVRDRVEPAHAQWQRNNILLREAYIKLGLDGPAAIAQTSAMLERLYAAEKRGPDAVRAVMEEIVAILRTLEDNTRSATDAGVTGFNNAADAAAQFYAEALKPIPPQTIKVAWDISNFPGLPSPTNPAGRRSSESGFVSATQADIDAFLRHNPGDEHRIQQAFSNITDPDLRAKYGFASGTMGRFLDFGQGTPVMLHGRERVMTEREARHEGGELAEIRQLIRDLPRAITIAQRDAMILAGVA